MGSWWESGKCYPTCCAGLSSPNCMLHSFLIIRTPFHADVLRSFSWSANVCGRKLWILYPPGQRHCNDSYVVSDISLFCPLTQPDQKGFFGFAILVHVLWKKWMTSASDTNQPAYLLSPILPNTYINCNVLLWSVILIYSFIPDMLLNVVTHC